MSEILIVASLAVAAYLSLIVVVALVSSAHPDPDRRHDAARLLGRLQRIRVHHALKRIKFR